MDSTDENPIIKAVYDMSVEELKLDMTKQAQNYTIASRAYLDQNLEQHAACCARVGYVLCRAVDLIDELEKRLRTYQK